MIEKTCVLIQGPLITYGQGPNISNIGFRAFDSIVKNTQLILVNRAIPVLCVWSSDTHLEEYKRIEAFYRQQNLSILILDVPKKFDPDHRFKHHFAIHSGLEYARNQFACSFFIKIRSDQQINQNIFEELVRVNGSGKMLISELMPNNNFYIGDFIYAGEYDIIQRYLLSQIRDNEAQIKYYHWQ